MCRAHCILFPNSTQYRILRFVLPSPPNSLDGELHEDCSGSVQGFFLLSDNNTEFIRFIILYIRIFDNNNKDLYCGTIISVANP